MYAPPAAMSALPKLRNIVFRRTSVKSKFLSATVELIVFRIR